MATRRSPGNDDSSGDERTVVSDRPQFTADPPGGEQQGAVFEEVSDTRQEALRAPPSSETKRVARPHRHPAKDTMGDVDESSNSISLIEAKSAIERGLSGFGDGVVIEEGPNPPNTEVLSLPQPDGAQPVDVKKWKAAPDGKEARGAMRAIELPATKVTPAGAHTRAEGASAVLGPSLDVEAVERMVSEALEMVRAARAHASRLDIEAGRGLNAQLSSAMHRLSELLAKLRG